MIGIINMKTNNINCIVKIIQRNNFKYKIINEYNDYNNDVEKIIIPGIGSYNSTMQYLKEKKIDKVIHEHNLNNKKILAICIGMQILTELGIEGGEINGLGLLTDSKTILLESDEILPNIGYANFFGCIKKSFSV
jgi:glutamine amidotransferase